jgi:hypothetical protein
MAGGHSHQLSLLGLKGSDKKRPNVKTPDGQSMTVKSTYRLCSGPGRTAHQKSGIGGPLAGLLYLRL